MSFFNFFVNDKGLREFSDTPITVYPGEDELLALTQGALRVLKGEEKLMEY